MIESCRPHLELFNPDYVNEAAGAFSIIERDEQGKGSATFKSSNPILLIRSRKQSPQIWALKQRKCADGAFLTFDGKNPHLHIVELKGKITLSTWAYVIQQFEGMYLTALAVIRLLGIQTVDGVTCYLAAKEDSVSKAEEATAAPILMKAPVGEVRTFGGLEDWINGAVSLPFSVKADLVKGWKNSSGDVDFGSV
jgi:hypothetical protein